MIHEIERRVMSLMLQRFHGQLANSVPEFGIEFFQHLAEDVVAEVIDFGQYEEVDYPLCDCGCNEGDEDHEDEHDDVWLAIDELWQRVEKLELGESVLSPVYHEH